MSIHSIHQYHNEVEKIIHFGGTKKETAVRNAFYNLLNEYAKSKGLMIVTEVTIKATNSNKNVIPDGTLKDFLRQDWGYWESKDESDDINEEIKKKFDKGYPKENILFEDSQLAVLIQNGIEIDRSAIRDTEKLHTLLTTFVNFERPEVRSFRKAIELFKQDIPKVTNTIRDIIANAEMNNSAYVDASLVFLKLCHDSINPDVTTDDVREMIIQHILTEDVFNTIFDENQFHRENNIAHQLEGVISTFFTGSIRKTALSSIQHYYQAINAAAAGIPDHHEKQKFLKVIYETFYKSYNPKAADRLGVVYTPNEIVQFMIKSTDYLLHKHFNKFLEDKNVEILDPATGTGTFICDIIDYISKDKLEYKYKNELHANEVAILPYYISNLNIEFTFTQRTGKYSEFENLCFVDTLDNMGFTFAGKQGNLFTPFTEENSKRIGKQNSRRIAVIIGNPPYNANQVSENDNNKNREYPEIDKRIKDTFIKYSTAQKTKVYDMYARFYRWAFDRLESNGIVAFVTNRSFIESRTFDGFRKTIQFEFDYAYIIDTKSDVRLNPKITGTTHNVFGIQTGIAIMFLVKKFSKTKRKQCTILYRELPDEWRKETKLQWLVENPLERIAFDHINPDDKSNWVNVTDNDFSSLVPLYTKNGDKKKVLFESLSLGISTNRDEWVYDFSEENLREKIIFILQKIKDILKEKDIVFDDSIKWSRDLKGKLSKIREPLEYNQDQIIKVSYRPFIVKYLYANKLLVDRLTDNHLSYKGPNLNLNNRFIHYTDANSGKPFMCLSSYLLSDLHFVGAGAGSANIAMYIYSSTGEKRENLTDWGLNQFIKKYGKKGVTKERIFYYIYAVLNCPTYRTKYEKDLKRDFPHIPFYDDFSAWSNWGQILFDLHAGYESVSPYDLVENSISKVLNPKPKLQADKDKGLVILDENTTLSGIPSEAWDYRLGNRSGLEWILEHYKENSPKDATIAERFNNYRFLKFKGHVIDQLKRICSVSVETMKIVKEMEMQKVVSE